MAKARRAIKPFTPDYCCEAHIVAYSGLFGKEINQVLTVYGDYGDKEKAKKMLKAKMERKIKKEYPGFIRYVKCEFYHHLTGMMGFCFGDKVGIDYEVI